MKRLYLIIVIVLSIIAGFIIEFKVSYSDLGHMVDFSIDQEGNVYSIKYKSDDHTYFLSKISKSGIIQYEIELEKAAAGANRYYEEIELDSEGNILLLMSDRKDIEGSAIDAGIINEKIVMYNSNGDVVREVATIDFSEDSALRYRSYICKFQVIGTEVSIICRRDNTYEILKTYTDKMAKPESQALFDIVPPNTTKTNEWLADMAVLNDGRVIYSDKSGKIYLMDEDKKFKDITSYVGNNVCAVTFSVDSDNNIYFTDAISGCFYKIDMNNMTIDSIYSKDSVINPKDKTKFGDVIYVKHLKDNQYSSISKDYKNMKFVIFGYGAYQISNIRHSILSYRLLIAILVSALILATVLLVYFIIGKLKEKTSLNFKIVLLFLPVYLLSMILLTILVLTGLIGQNTRSLTKSQVACNRIILEHVDGDLFNNLNHMHDYLSSDYITLQNQIFNGFYDAKKAISDSADYIVTYKVANNTIYRTISNEFKTVHEMDDVNINYEGISEPCVPIEYELSYDAAQKYYDILENLKSQTNNDNNIGKHVIGDNYGEWIGVCEPIKNSNGDVVGMIESRIEKTEHQDKVYWKTFIVVAVTLVAVTAAIFTYFFIVLGYTFRPLRKLKRCVNDISEGKWNTKVSIDTKDEFYDIGLAINSMTDKMNQYISNLVVLNNEYIKFVPQELFKLLGKSKITDIHLYDRKTNRVNILYVTFNLSHHIASDDVSDEKYFDALNRSFDALFAIVESNGGVVQSFDGLSITVLFPNSANDAVAASVQFREILGKSVLKGYVRITLSTGDMIIGVIGNKKRMSIAAVSNEIANLDNILAKINKVGVNHFAMQPIIDSLDGKIKYDYRLIGHVKHILGGKPVKIYELIDKNNLYISTKNLFEQGVKYYMDGDLIRARKTFADVLKINEEDKVAMYYLFLCNDNNDSNLQGWNGYLL